MHHHYENGCDCSMNTSGSWQLQTKNELAGSSVAGGVFWNGADRLDSCYVSGEVSGW